MRYPYDAISFILHAISHCYIVRDIFAVAYDIAMQKRMQYSFDAILHTIFIAVKHAILHMMSYVMSYAIS